MVLVKTKCHISIFILYLYKYIYLYKSIWEDLKDTEIQIINTLSNTICVFFINGKSYFYHQITDL